MEGNTVSSCVLHQMTSTQWGYTRTISRSVIQHLAVFVHKVTARHSYFPQDPYLKVNNCSIST